MNTGTDQAKRSATRPVRRVIIFGCPDSITLFDRSIWPRAHCRFHSNAICVFALFNSQWLGGGLEGLWRVRIFCTQEGCNIILFINEARCARALWSAFICILSSISLSLSFMSVVALLPRCLCLLVRLFVSLFIFCFVGWFILQMHCHAMCNCLFIVESVRSEKSL